MDEPPGIAEELVVTDHGRRAQRRQRRIRVFTSAGVV
ncbi:hypothetical protein E1A91_A09G136000v1 [Gossypium mustelinum]|uniref:Uncharacterized protein n=1 Tax=Gossypium mustelinum TaxID=34275 RepID=A0A5D2XWY9_GOSMU|nr:hypothetical protein E1A91_A09G136000v1 [Gossypium mustelinum]